MLKTKLTSWSNISVLCQSHMPRRVLEAPLKTAALSAFPASWNCEAQSLLVAATITPWAASRLSSSESFVFVGSSFTPDRSNAPSCPAPTAGASFECSSATCERYERHWPQFPAAIGTFTATGQVTGQAPLPVTGQVTSPTGQVPSQNTAGLEQT
jgi:hypothetical protein